MQTRFDQFNVRERILFKAMINHRINEIKMQQKKYPDNPIKRNVWRKYQLYLAEKLLSELKKKGS